MKEKALNGPHGGMTRRPFAVWWGVVACGVGLHAAPALAATWHVDRTSGSDNNPGTSAQPFATISKGVEAAQAGDEVVIRSGTYPEQLRTVRGGSGDSERITIRAFPGDEVVVSLSGRVLVVGHPYVTIDSLVFDGQFAATVAATADYADGLIIRNSQIRNSGRDCLDIDDSADILIEGSAIHHCLRWVGGRLDAHGVTGGGAVNRLTIRNTEIYQFSGDAVQFTPNRSFWDNLVIEGSRMWLEPLAEPTAGFPAGQRTGENGFDSKTPSSGPRSRVTIRDSEFHGFRDVLDNHAALNMKENIDAVIERCTIWDSDVALRLRHPARVTVKNTVLYDNARAARVEDGIQSLHLYHNTFGGGHAAFFERGGLGAGSDFQVVNNLFLAASLPAQAAAGDFNLAVGASAFRNVAQREYHLAVGSPAIDAASTLPEVRVDRDGLTRPYGPAPDVGAYEFTGGAAAGDLDGDGQVTLADLLLQLKMLVGSISVDLARADLDGDGALTLGDVRALVAVMVTP